MPSDDPEKHFDCLLKRLQESAIDLVVLARYMRILPPRIVQTFRSRIINIHPSLLPYFPGYEIVIPRPPLLTIDSGQVLRHRQHAADRVIEHLRNQHLPRAGHPAAGGQ